jgi:hypothetical protein
MNIETGEFRMLPNETQPIIFGNSLSANEVRVEATPTQIEELSEKIKLANLHKKHEHPKGAF